MTFLLRSTEARLRTFVYPFELPESSYRCGTYAVHLRAIDVAALARVASFRSQILDSRQNRSSPSNRRRRRCFAASNEVNRLRRQPIVRPLPREQVQVK